LRKNTKVDLISKVPLFAGLSKSQLGQVATLADELDLSAGEGLIREGGRGRGVFVLLEGEGDGRRKGRENAAGRKGGCIGETALVSNVPRVATVTAITPVRVLVIRSQDFRTLLRRYPDIALKVLVTVADRLSNVDF